MVNSGPAMRIILVLAVVIAVIESHGLEPASEDPPNDQKSLNSLQRTQGFSSEEIKEIIKSLIFPTEGKIVLPWLNIFCSIFEGH